MGLLIPDPPKGSLASLRDSLSVLAGRGSFSAEGLREARPEQISATIPHQVFNLTLEDARSAEGIDRARPAGWRYLLAVGDRVVASAETHTDDGEQQVFSHVNAGPFVEGTVEALAVAERFADTDEPSMELRLLNVPAVYLMAVWLHSQQASNVEGVFIPVAPAPSGLEPSKVYQAKEFAALLRELAQAIPELDPEDARGGA
jgi:hypothetical protein